MSESENFLSRWARRKREAEQEAQHEPPLESKKDAAPGAEPEAKADADTDLVVENDSAPAKAEAESFDIDSLPPLESINAATDIRDFLRPGVPADLSRAALRRAWSADPAIRDLIGLSETAWDFTDTNDDGLCNEGEPFEDINGNGTWDDDRGRADTGSARDAVMYSVTVTYPRAFPVMSLLGFSDTVTAKARTVLRNQPYGPQNKPAAVGSCE